ALGIRGGDFARLERGEPVRVGTGIVHPSDVLGPPRPGRSIIYSGDSAPAGEIQRLAHRGTALIHEATVAADLEAEANRWGHSSARQAATLAAAAEVDALFLTHFSSRYKEVDLLESEAREVFPASTAAREFITHLLKQP
ncbi:ribonuclease Z, partial [mine drainage metagenome]